MMIATLLAEYRQYSTNSIKILIINYQIFIIVICILLEKVEHDFLQSHDDFTTRDIRHVCEGSALHEDTPASRMIPAVVGRHVGLADWRGAHLAA